MNVLSPPRERLRPARHHLWRAMAVGIVFTAVGVFVALVVYELLATVWP